MNMKTGGHARPKVTKKGFRKKNVSRIAVVCLHFGSAQKQNFFRLLVSGLRRDILFALPVRPVLPACLSCGSATQSQLWSLSTYGPTAQLHFLVQVQNVIVVASHCSQKNEKKI